MLAAVAIVIVLVERAGTPAPSSVKSEPSGSGLGTVTMQRRDLVATDTESGTVGYADPRTAYNRLSGTITWLPRVGQVIKPGQTLFRVNGEPIVLMDGSAPAFRVLSASDSPGADIEQLNRNLVRLGFNSDGIVDDDQWQAATTVGVEMLQESLGETQSGRLSLGQVVFLPGARVISALDGAVGSTGGGGAVAQIAHQPGVLDDVAVYQVSSANVYRSPHVSVTQTGGIGVDAAGTNLPRVLGTTMASGHCLGAISQRFPEVVLGAEAAQTLGVIHPGVLVYIANRYFTVVGIMTSALLDTTLDSTVFISLPVAERIFQLAPNPSEIYVRANQDQVENVANRLPASTDPQNPSGVAITRPSDALEARAAAKGQFTTLLLGLGAVALLVGAIGIANIMVISVLERRGEIGLRRALGATRMHITIQFLTESALLAILGGIAGLAFGALATLTYAHTKSEPFVLPTWALIAGWSAPRRVVDRY